MLCRYCLAEGVKVQMLPLVGVVYCPCCEYEERKAK